MSIKVEGVEALNRRLKILEDTIGQLIEPVILDAATELMQQMVAATPVDTGKLQSNFKLKAGRLKNSSYVDIKNRTRYAMAVEYGTERTPGQSFMRSIAQSNRKRVWKRLKVAGERAIERKTAQLGRLG